MDVLIVIPPTGFIDGEVTASIEIFNESNVSFEIASTDSSYCKGESGMIVKPDKIISEVSPSHYTTILVIGGEGSKNFFWENESILSMIKDAYSHGDIIAGLNSAVVVLANAGILEGKKATTSSSPDALDNLSSHGAMFVQKPVVVDGNVITAEGPYAILEFMVQLLDLMGVEWYTI